VKRAPPERGAGGREALRDWEFSHEEVEWLVSLGLGFMG
jgi:hypothetical protein